jgi:hypothetical protein
MPETELSRIYHSETGCFTLWSCLNVYRSEDELSNVRRSKEKNLEDGDILG